MVRRTSLDTLSSFASTASEESDLDRTIPAAGEGAAGEADVGDQYAPQYAIAKDALSVLWTDMAVALYHKFAAV